MASFGTGLRRNVCLEKAAGALSAYAGSPSLVNPPVNIESVAEWLGFQVVLLYTVEDEFSGLVSLPQKLIGVNGKHHRHRRRFTIGHELAHILLKHPPESRCSHGEIALYNAEADLCAAELLIPSTMLRTQLHMTTNISALAKAFDVSEEAMRVKLKTLPGREPPSTHS